MNWYLIFTKPREEGRVERNLHTGGVIYYSPKLRKITTRKREIVSVIEPLFPRYIFVKTFIKENFRKIKYTRGVVGFVDFGYGPVSVAQGIIDDIRGREKDGVIDMVYRRKKFVRNERMRIKRGLLSDLDVIFENYVSGGDRVNLLLGSVSSSIKLNIPTEYL